ncbi:hypothetical protein G9A89_003635 [Geosiphon pyriformis]|nr:hypothetical protein G9A89_003635 [Geosiphon pyriformis]
MAEKKVIDKGEIIFTCQLISILSYDQYMIVIEKKVKDQIQIFKAEATLCESGEIELINLYIPIRKMLFVPTKTIGTDELRKSRLTTMYTA